MNAAAILASVNTIKAVVGQFSLASTVQALDAINVSLLAQTTVLQKIADALVLESPSVGRFDPPPDLVKFIPVEVMMSVMQLEVGQTAVGKLTFDETTAPADGAVVSDTPTVATIVLAPDKMTWTCVAMAVGVANISYTGISAPPDVGPAIVPNMVVTVIAVPVAEHGDFDPTHAVITGP
ncbi:MAG TPA: hypothetical protein VMP38_03275 [Candidatus Acidoferrum sp.]|nr:hypothetical protein [Candidatus Acidoferrum sp.]